LSAHNPLESLDPQKCFCSIFEVENEGHLALLDELEVRVLVPVTTAALSAC